MEVTEEHMMYYQIKAHYRINGGEGKKAEYL